MVRWMRERMLIIPIPSPIPTRRPCQHLLFLAILNPILATHPRRVAPGDAGYGSLSSSWLFWVSQGEPQPCILHALPLKKLSTPTATLYEGRITTTLMPCFQLRC